MITTLLWDLGGVLYQIDVRKTQEAFRKLATHNPPHYALTEQEKLFSDYETGKISTEQFLKTLQQNYFPKASLSAIQNAWNSLLIGPFPYAKNLLEAAQKNYNLYLLSNINPLHHEAAKEAIESLLPYFKKVFFSYQIGLRKPEEEIYRYVLETIKTPPNQILFIDDSIKNIEGAKKVGLKTFWFHSPAALEKLCEQLSLKTLCL